MQLLMHIVILHSIGKKNYLSKIFYFLNYFPEFQKINSSVLCEISEDILCSVALSFFIDMFSHSFMSNMRERKKQTCKNIPYSLLYPDTMKQNVSILTLVIVLRFLCHKLMFYLMRGKFFI